MKKVLLAIGFALMMATLSSCNKDLSDNGGTSTLEGHYVCQKVEIIFTNGETWTITDEEDWVREDEYSFDFEDSDYILFEYEYIFTNGRYKYKNDYTNSLMDGSSYSVKNGVLSLGFLGMEAATYKIVSNSGSALVLEATEDYIKLANLSNDLYGAPLSIKKTTATYTFFDKNSIEVPHNDSFIVGCWAEMYPEDGNKVQCYEEYTKNGQYISYELSPDDVYATYENGTLTTPAGATWKTFETGPYSFSYSSGSCVYLVYSYPITIIDDNTITRKDSSHWTTYLYRITKFK